MSTNYNLGVNILRWKVIGPSIKDQRELFATEGVNAVLVETTGTHAASWQLPFYDTESFERAYAVWERIGNMGALVACLSHKAIVNGTLRNC